MEKPRKISALQKARNIRHALEDKKGEDVVVLNVKEVSGVTDYYVLVTGLNGPHVRALADQVDAVMKTAGVRPYRRAGTPESEWIVADYADVVVHIFSPRTRRYYEFERLWRDAKPVR